MYRKKVQSLLRSIIAIITVTIAIIGTTAIIITIIITIIIVTPIGLSRNRSASAVHLSNFYGKTVKRLP